MHRRMAMLRLDVDAWLDTEPAMLADMQQSCSACANRGRCAYDLMLQLDEPLGMIGGTIARTQRG